MDSVRNIMFSVSALHLQIIIKQSHAYLELINRAGQSDKAFHQSIFCILKKCFNRF